MNISWCHESYTAMAMFEVIPVEELRDKGPCLGQRVKAIRKVPSILERLELCLRVWVVI